MDVGVEGLHRDLERRGASKAHGHPAEVSRGLPSIGAQSAVALQQFLVLGQEGAEVGGADFLLALEEELHVDGQRGRSPVPAVSAFQKGLDGLDGPQEASLVILFFKKKMREFKSV